MNFCPETDKLFIEQAHKVAVMGERFEAEESQGLQHILKLQAFNEADR